MASTFYTTLYSPHCCKVFTVHNILYTVMQTVKAVYTLHIVHYGLFTQYCIPWSILFTVKCTKTQHVHVQKHKCLKASWRRCYYPHWSRDALSPVCGIFLCYVLGKREVRVEKKYNFFDYTSYLKVLPISFQEQPLFLF